METGNLELAENFLNQAKGLAPEDYNVLTEWAYLRYRQAIADPIHPESAGLAEEPRQLLRSLIGRRGDRAQFAFHVYGSQRLAWVRRLTGESEEVRAALNDASLALTHGPRRHPYSDKLKSLSEELKRALLEAAVATRQTE